LIVVFAFEMPTGAAADLVGRKASFRPRLRLAYDRVQPYAVATTCTDGLIAEMIDGVGTTLANGALDAWAIDPIRPPIRYPLRRNPPPSGQ